MIKFEKEYRGGYTYICFWLRKEISPFEAFDKIKLPLDKNDFNDGIVFHDRGDIKAPSWLYAYFISQAYPAKWVGVFEASLAATIVVKASDSDKEVGNIIFAGVPEDYLGNL